MPNKSSPFFTGALFLSQVILAKAFTCQWCPDVERWGNEPLSGEDQMLLTAARGVGSTIYILALSTCFMTQLFGRSFAVLACMILKMVGVAVIGFTTYSISYPHAWSHLLFVACCVVFEILWVKGPMHIADEDLRSNFIDVTMVPYNLIKWIINGIWKKRDEISKGSGASQSLESERGDEKEIKTLATESGDSGATTSTTPL